MRVEAIEDSPRAFGISADDEWAMSTAARRQRLEQNYVAGGFLGEELGGIFGFVRFRGAKVAHKGSLWGMYVREQARGSGLADAIMGHILEHARTQVELVMLTVASDNERAHRFYRRWGFVQFGVEPHTMKMAEGDYLDGILMVRHL